MKNKYESPIAEKIKFNYRDQVVAASGVADSGERNNGNVTNTSNPLEEFFHGILGFGTSACDNTVAWLLDFGGMSACD